MALKKIKSLLNFYKNCLYNAFLNNKCLSRIENIDPEKKKVIIQTRGINAPIILEFDEIIRDEDVINSLAPEQSAIFGYYYGVYYFSLFAKNTYFNGSFNCFKYNLLSKCTIYALDRHNNIVYIDQDTCVKYTKTPNEIMLDKNLIIKFSPLQSCYIGILAGIYQSNIDPIKKPINYNGLKLV